jgi:hypothetical protein
MIWCSSPLWSTFRCRCCVHWSTITMPSCFLEYATCCVVHVCLFVCSIHLLLCSVHSHLFCCSPFDAPIPVTTIVSLEAVWVLNILVLLHAIVSCSSRLPLHRCELPQIYVSLFSWRYHVLCVSTPSCRCFLLWYYDGVTCNMFCLRWVHSVLAVECTICFMVHSLVVHSAFLEHSVFIVYSFYMTPCAVSSWRLCCSADRIAGGVVGVL